MSSFPPRVTLLATILVLTLTGAAAALNPEVPNPCTYCAFDPPTAIVAEPGATLKLVGTVGNEDYLTAISCGDLACLYHGAGFALVDPAFTITGPCGQYAGPDDVSGPAPTTRSR